MLTGESTSITKNQITDYELENVIKLNSEPNNKNTLYQGTKIIKTRPGNLFQKVNYQNMEDTNPVVLALVLRTGFNTAKGSLIKAILSPKPIKFKFYEDSLKFIRVMSLIAVIGFFFSLFYFIKLEFKVSKIILRLLDLVVIVVPPALPATMAIGTAFAVERLRKSGIFCCENLKINVSSRVDYVCFDKTVIHFYYPGNAYTKLVRISWIAI